MLRLSLFLFSGHIFGGSAPPNPHGFAPWTPSSLISLSMSTGRCDAGNMGRIHPYTMIIVHAYTMIIVHASSLIIIHACTMILVHACDRDLWLINLPPWGHGVKLMNPQPGPNLAVSQLGNFFASPRQWARDLTLDILIAAAFSLGHFWRVLFFFEPCFFYVRCVDAQSSLRYPSAGSMFYYEFHKHLLSLNGICKQLALLVLALGSAAQAWLYTSFTLPAFSPRIWFFEI